MTIRLLAGTATCAVLLGVATPVFAASGPEFPGPEFSGPAFPGRAYPGSADQVSQSAQQAVNAFYTSRGGAPLWLRGGVNNDSARALIGILQRARLDGFDSGPGLATQAQALLARAQTGDPAALSAADRLLSAAWIGYVETLQRPPEGMVYADRGAMPPRMSPLAILDAAGKAPSLSAYLQSVSEVNPLYAQLRDAAWAEMQSSGGMIDPRVLISLDRARERPSQHKYIIVDTAAARLYMVQDGRIVGSMEVAVGKPDPKTQTPMLASTIYYATLNPYWHVSPELVRSLIAKNVLSDGLGYLKEQGYQIMPADPNDDTILDPSKIDWQAVADGSLDVRVRELPGPRNSMGRVKFGFPNRDGIYLHDTPVKALFDQDDRTISHGCIRLQDAQRLEQWMMAGEPVTTSDTPEDHVALPTPVPIYITYLTAQAHDGQISFVDDIYGRDTEVAIR